MSFILEALKKSESERQRQSGPALFEVKVAPPRSRFTLWISILGALLLINVVGVGWMLLHGSAPHGAAAASLAGASPAASPPLGVTTAPGTAASPRVALTPLGAAPVSAPAAGAIPAASLPPAATEAAGSANPEDLAPAVEPARAASTGVVRATTSGLPTYQDAAAAPGANIPELRLDLHSYSGKPDERFVFLNMTKLHEGDSLPQGVRVEAITPDGVILSYQGSRFILQHQ